MSRDQGIRRGYLLLADISGYTAFLTGTELDHATGVIDDLTTCVIEHLPPPLRIVKLEGDAVFAYALEEVFSDGERVLEIVEQCYVAFHDRIDDIVRQTTCTCVACTQITTLDLKFVVHFGEFVVQRTTGVEDLAGKDVIIVHRLLKNRVAEEVGTKAYCLLTDAVTQHMQAPLELPAHRESYETLGPLDCMVESLDEILEARRRDRHIVVTADEADVDIEIHLAAPRPVAWDWYVAPDRMVRFEAGITGADARPNANGRMGIGAELHCAHGSGRAVRQILDWKPFDYFTEHLNPVRPSLATPAASHTTSEFRDRPDGTTTLHYRARFLEPSMMLRLMKPLVKRAYRRTFRDTERRFRELVEQGEVAVGTVGRGDGESPRQSSERR